MSILNFVFIDVLTFLKAIIVILGLGHFTIAYFYGYFSSERKLNFSISFFVLMSFVTLSFFSSVRTEVFLLLASVLFTIHHGHDVYKIFTSKIETIFWFAYGFIASYFIYRYAILKIDSNITSVVMFWIMTLYHYLMWYWFYYHKLKGEKRKSYIRQVVFVHLILATLFFLSYSYETISFILGFRFFYIQTIAHILFSYYGYFIRLNRS